MQDSILLAQQSLINRLLNNLPAGYSSNHVKLPNARFTTPDNRQWLRVTNIVQDKENVEAGGSYKRTFGLFVVDIFYPKGSGDVAALTDAEAIQSAFENQEFDNAKCLEAEVAILGEEEAWYATQISISYYFEGA